MELSERLQAVADMVTAGSIVCDVGCDHGYIPIYLIRQQICPKVIAMDVNEGPLERARKHVRNFGLEEYIVTRRSDGVAALEAGEADCLILAGMGGRLIVRILTEGSEKACAAKEIILQPQSDLVSVRRFLRQTGYRICREDMVYEDGKYYPLIKAAYVCGKDGAVYERADGRRMETDCGADDESIHRQACDRYGEDLLENRHPVLHRYLLWEQERDGTVLRNIAASAPENAAQAKRCRQREAELMRAAEIREYALSWFPVHGGERSCLCAAEK